jgi:8-oxo-dGTP pyrophosphatase MutT (NUDIX family)
MTAWTFGEALRRRVAGHLAGFGRRTVEAEGLRPAAVAVALVADDAGRACFVLTVRGDLRRHGGQFALPGGKLDPGETAVEAALRELEEEVGLSVSPQAVLGLLDDYPTRSGYRITPVVVWAAGAGELVPDPREVAAVFRVPLADLDTREVPLLSSIPESDRPVLAMPVLGTQVFAPTAAVLYQLREVALHGRPTRVAQYEQPVWAWR